jgi:hypothetical protein
MERVTCEEYVSNLVFEEKDVPGTLLLEGNKIYPCMTLNECRGLSGIYFVGRDDFGEWELSEEEEEDASPIQDNAILIRDSMDLCLITDVQNADTYYPATYERECVGGIEVREEIVDVRGGQSPIGSYYSPDNISPHGSRWRIRYFSLNGTHYAIDVDCIASNVEFSEEEDQDELQRDYDLEYIDSIVE